MRGDTTRTRNGICNKCYNGDYKESTLEVIKIEKRDGADFALLKCRICGHATGCYKHNWQGDKQ